MCENKLRRTDDNTSCIAEMIYIPAFFDRLHLLFQLEGILEEGLGLPPLLHLQEGVGQHDAQLLLLA